MVVDAGMPSDKGGSFDFETRFPATSLAQYPRGGRGTFIRLQVFAIATSETPYSTASFRMGVLHTWR